jgi:hypothetical protein
MAGDDEFGGGGFGLRRVNRRRRRLSRAFWLDSSGVETKDGEGNLLSNSVEKGGRGTTA